MGDSRTTFCSEVKLVTIVPRAIFRVDGSLDIGSGHVRRCLVLAETLAADGWSITFACRAGMKEAVPPLARSAFSYRLLPADCDEITELRDLALEGCDLLVVDHYGLDSNFERSCRPWAKKILVIDDLADRPHDCDMLVDQTPGRQASDYMNLVPDDCVFLVGAEFALLDPRFRRARECLGPPVEKVRRVLVNFGGTDPAGATALALEALSEAALGAAVDVVLGTETEDLGRIRRLASELDPPAVVHVSVGDMASLVARADMAIGASGVSGLERCCLGLPSITMTIADNQRKLAGELARLGATENLGSVKKLTARGIAEAVSSLASAPDRRLAMRAAAIKITDGLGAARIRAACYPSLVAKDGRPVQLRLATMADSSLMLAWQSAPGARAHSRNPQPPKPAEHTQWLKNKLADPRCIFHVVLHDGHPVGVLRLDRQPSGAYEISILIAAEAHNRNIGGAALQLVKRLMPDAVVHAAIHPKNIASIHMFERAGYFRAGAEWTLTPASPLRSVSSL
jgi:UDP-2,4-diacetamido-2,4,6-trideoxy-beta-L-altropyranose hydrolase